MLAASGRTTRPHFADGETCLADRAHCRLYAVPAFFFEWLGDGLLMGKYGHMWIVAYVSCHVLMLVVYVSINARSVEHVR